MGEMVIVEVWELHLSKEYINLLELIAIKYVILLFHQMVRGKHVLICMDNTMVITYINKQGGTISWKLFQLAVYLWDIRLEIGTRLIAVHVPGALNTQADFLSRGGGLP